VTRGWFSIFCATCILGCTPAPRGATPASPDGVPVASPPAPDTAVIRRLAQATSPDEPLQIFFDWSIQDRDFRVQGKGTARLQGPYRVRVDLFAGQDIQVLRAVMIDDKLDLVHSGPSVPLPPVEFLWSVVGVFRAPVGASLAAMTRDGDGLTLSYEEGASRWRFRADSTSLKSAEWQGSDGGRRTVELSGPYRFGRPSKASYRDWREFRELVLTVTAVEKVEPFAPETWNVSSR
jgi:hypothetical protein